MCLDIIHSISISYQYTHHLAQVAHYSPSQHTQSTHPLNPPSRSALLVIHPLNQSINQSILSTHPSTHPINQSTVSTHPLDLFVTNRLLICTGNWNKNFSIGIKSNSNSKHHNSIWLRCRSVAQTHTQSFAHSLHAPNTSSWHITDPSTNTCFQQSPYSIALSIKQGELESKRLAEDGLVQANKRLSRKLEDSEQLRLVLEAQVGVLVSIHPVNISS